MERKTDAEIGNELPAGLSQPALRALAGAGYTRLEQLAQARETDIKKLHGMGPKGLRQLRAALEDKGLSFANSTEKQS